MTRLQRTEKQTLLLLLEETLVVLEDKEVLEETEEVAVEQEEGREVDEDVIQDPEGTRTSKDLPPHPESLMQQAAMTPPPHPWRQGMGHHWEVTRAEGEMPESSTRRRLNLVTKNMIIEKRKTF